LKTFRCAYIQPIETACEPPSSLQEVYPQQLVEDADLTVNEKPAILASWASERMRHRSLPRFETAEQRPSRPLRRHHGRA
jgi:hypothetical protein